MARDDFSRTTVDRMAKRVGMKCSNPDCRQPTSGPDAKGGTTNAGVACHITAASPGGPRYEAQMDSAQRSDIQNGIWLCQNHAKLIDDDELTYPPSLLKEWKETAEHMAALETRGYAIARANPFPSLERKAPALVAEMRADLGADPLVREFVLLSKRWTYNYGPVPCFTYYFEEHNRLLSIMTIMEHAGAIYSVKMNDIERYNFNESFVRYLIGDND